MKRNQNQKWIALIAMIGTVALASCAEPLPAPTPPPLVCDQGKANCDKNDANGCEASTDSDAKNCGACGNQCQSVNGTATCNGGQCQVACTPPALDCDGDAANGCEVIAPATDPNNCGGCGVRCLPVHTGMNTCTAGVCKPAACEPDFGDCDGNGANGCETNLVNDDRYCGACGNQCGPDRHCVGKSCECVQPFTNCMGFCANLRTDIANCGACGKKCAPREVCNAGSCTDTCPPEQIACNGGCVNTMLDPSNCGGCGKVCKFANAAATCQNGACLIGTCRPGFGDCDGDPTSGCEVNLNSDPSNCDRCGRKCLAPNGIPACNAGVCQIGACSPGFGDCNGLLQDGCEANLVKDVKHCGACGNACTVANATAACVNGCAIAVCDTGFADCDNNPKNGCEVNLNTDAGNCGGCGKVCKVANGLGACADGACGIAKCAAGFEDCNLDAGDGCEVNVNKDAQNCGTCAKACGNATPACFNGACSATCSDNLTNGGETDTDCGFVCAPFNKRCADSKRCQVNADCQSNLCGSGFCQPQPGCNDKVKNGDESDDDCGGRVCLRCAAGQRCNNSGDCQSGVCNAQFSCATPSCRDGVHNGFESDVDCGGPCQPCPDWGSCWIQNHCQSGVCLGNVCRAPTCRDGVLNGNESDIDCGGGCNTRCADGQGCGQDSDCRNAWCKAGVCATPTCMDRIKNDGETDVDCGGPCQPCANSLGCKVNRDCQSGVCKSSLCVPPTCNDNTLNGKETDLDCGGLVCAPCFNGAGCFIGTDCQSGVCRANVCQPPACNDLVKNGQESDTDCGGPCALCLNGQRCASDADCLSAACPSGRCVCGPGFGDCNNNPGDGCEINNNTNANHCGACGNVCPGVPNGQAACDFGRCAVATCNQGFANCDNLYATGCEVNTLTDVGNCGGCGRICPAPPNGVPGCSAGTCGLASCRVGFGNCDNDGANGCEANLNTNISHCGACGRVCNLANASASCAGGACGIAACNPGFKDCDGNVASGCEASANTDVNNCGGCNLVCQFNNGTPSCNAGSCSLAGCNVGFGNCDNNGANGCESNTNTNVNHCGGCGKMCPAVANGTPACNAGTCGLAACNAGFGNCDGNGANGCEVNLNADKNNCGACAVVCAAPNGTPACVQGACAVAACNAGFRDCDGLPVNGCEVNFNTDAGNCGVCGLRCLQNQACFNGACQPVCNDGARNGAETDTDCGGNVCGRCVEGKACAVGADCVSGVCTNGRCAATCNDQVKNGLETDTDCGGACPVKCAATKGCMKAADCASGVCTNNACVASCQDGVKNQNETDTDCGGLCPKCANTKACSVAADCQSGVCSNNVCAVPTCQDGVKNGSETDLDCGGACQSKCAAGRACVGGSDCASSRCTNQLCEAIPASCSDGMKNNLETDLDCGGGSCPKCADTKACGVGADCQSGVCSGGKCAAPACNDLVKNGTETDTDCGGNNACSRCADTKSCSSGADCASGVCTDGVCRAPTCSDAVKNGQETDVDCGGGTCLTCLDGRACAANADCASGVCTGGKCVPPLQLVDQRGMTPLGASGANGGPSPDGTRDDWDDDGDGACETAPCAGSLDLYLNARPALLKGGDCDDNPRDGGPITVKRKYEDGKACAANADCASAACAGGKCAPFEVVFTTDGSHWNCPILDPDGRGKEWCDNYDNNCDGQVDNVCLP